MGTLNQGLGIQSGGDGVGTGTVTSVSGTTNRITITGTPTVNPTVDIAATYVGQTSITTLGTIGTGTWQGTSISTSFTDAKIKTVTGTSNRLTIGGTATDPTFDISTSYVGQATITTVGTITSGTWSGSFGAVSGANLTNLTAANISAGTAGINITGTAPAGTLTGTTLNSTVVTTSITSTGTMTSGTLSTGYVVAGVTMTLGSDATGDVYYRSAGGVLTRLAAGAAGTFLRFAGAGAAPVVSTLVLPNAATANQVIYATATNTHGGSANLTFDGTTLNVGAATSTGSIVEIKADTAFAGLRSLVGSTSNFAIYLNQTTPSATNYAISSNSTSSTNINAPAANTATGINLLAGGNVRVLITNTKVDFTPTGATTGVNTAFSFTTSSTTGQTASTEVPAVDFNLAAALQHAAGALTTQRTMVIRAATYTFVSASTITDAVTFEVTAAPTAGSNTTITRAWAARLLGNVAIGTSLHIGSATGVIAPTALLHLGAGTATASTAPLKFTSGTNNTTAEAGAMEYNGTNLFFTRTGTTREGVLVGNRGATAPATNTIGVVVDYYGTSATRVLTTPNTWFGVTGDDGNVYKIPGYS